MELRFMFSMLWTCTHTFHIDHQGNWTRVKSQNSKQNEETPLVHEQFRRLIELEYGWSDHFVSFRNTDKEWHIWVTRHPLPSSLSLSVSPFLSLSLSRSFSLSLLCSALVTRSPLYELCLFKMLYSNTFTLKLWITAAENVGWRPMTVINYLSSR